MTDTTGQKRVPNVRFKGFTDDWEQRKLGEVSEITAGGDKNNSILRKKGKYPVIANAINTNGIIGYYDEYYRIKAPALTVTGRGDIGHATARFTNFTPVVRLLALTTSENVTFLANAINNIKIYNESTGVPQLTKPQLSNYKVAITSGDEENLIATLLEKLDNQITLYQQKLSLLKQLKQGMLQKLFINSENKQPLLRFNKFHGDWEQRKLGEVVNLGKGKGYSKNNLVKQGSPVFLYGRLYTQYREETSEVDTFAHTSSDAVLSSGNEVVLPDSGETAADIARASWVSAPNIILGGGLLITSPKTKLIFPGFLSYALTYGKNHRVLASRAQGKSIVHIHLADLENLEIIFPLKYDEQSRIYNLLKTINNLIVLYQNKINTLTNLKKFLLQQMFI